MQFIKKNLLVFVICFFSVPVFSQSTVQQIDKSINKASLYIKNNPNFINSHILLHLHYFFVKKWNYVSPFDITKLLANKSPYADERFAKYTMRRMLDDNYKLNLSYIDSFNNDELVDKFLIWSMYADKKKINQEYNSILKDFSDTSKHIRLTAHVALGLNCIEALGLENQLTEKNVKEKIVNRLTNHLNSIDTAIVTDSDMEAMFGLILLGRKDLINEKWIINMINSANENGVWAFNEHEGGTLIHQHPTTLALGILLAMKCENCSYHLIGK